jgi:hypothetical protein
MAKRILLITLIVAFWVAIAHYLLVVSEKRECLLWIEQEAKNQGYHLTDWQKEYCKEVLIKRSTK